MSTSANRVTIKGTAVVIEGNDIDTDRIVPARFLKEITFENMGDYLFYDVRFNEDDTQKSHPLNEPQNQKAAIMIVGKNFGCGSSREHAAQAILRFGIQAIIGESFGEIFAGNCKSVGIPVLTSTPETLASLKKILEEKPSTSVTIDLVDKTAVLENHSFPISIVEAWRQAFLNGSWNALAILKANTDKIKALDASLSYKF